MLWDDTESWHEGLHSLESLHCLLLRSWQPLPDFKLSQWLIASSTRLRELNVWSGAQASTGCQVIWYSMDGIKWDIDTLIHP